METMEMGRNDMSFLGSLLGTGVSMGARSDKATKAYNAKIAPRGGKQSAREAKAAARSTKGGRR